jgi:hypothetical protein
MSVYSRFTSFDLYLFLYLFSPLKLRITHTAATIEKGERWGEKEGEIEREREGERDEP